MTTPRDAVAAKPRKIVLSYSGGLDTSTVLSWLVTECDAEVVVFLADLGQGVDHDVAERKASKLGASKVYIKDLRCEFLEDYAFRCLRADALYQSKYPLHSTLSRPMLAKQLVDLAREENTDVIAHGCSGKGNDQLRFASAIATLAPEMTMLTPLIDWPLHSRADQIDYATAHGIEIPVTASAPYSFDENLWGRSISCGPIEDLALRLPADIYALTCSYQDAPDKPCVVEVGFEAGTPVLLDGRRLGSVALVEELNRIAGANSVGRIEHMEDKVVGIKTREVYECPAASVLYRAHADLEELTLDKDTLDTVRQLSHRYAELAYSGRWFSPLRDALDAFVRESQRYVTGHITLELYRGNCTVIRRASPYALYDHKLSTYDRTDQFDHASSTGFMKISTVAPRILSRARTPADRTSAP